MKKFFLTNLIFLISLNLLIKAFWILGIDREVQNVLDAKDYGLYYALLNFTYIFNIILDLGITQFNNRTIAQNTHLLKKYFAKIIPLKLLLALVYAIIVILVAKISNYDSGALFIVKWLCVFQILTSLLTYLRSNISSLMLFKVDSVLSVLDKSLSIVFCSILLWTNIIGRMKIEYFVYVQVLSLGIANLVALIICLSKTHFIRPVWDAKFMIKILKFGFPYALLTLLMSFYNRMDSVMLERMLVDGKQQASIYASGFRLVDSVNMVAYLFSIILLPLFAKMIKEKLDIKPIVKSSFQLLLFIGISFVTISVIYAKDLMTLLYNKHIEQSANVFQVLCMCFIPISMTYIFGTLLTSNGNLKKLNLVALCGMITNIVINLILIPRYKALGSAYSALITQIITSLIQVVIALRLFKIRFSWTYFIRIIIFVFLIVLISVILNEINTLWYYRVIISLVCFVLIAFICKIFLVSELKGYVVGIIRNKK